jgi:hypothetical protein
MVRVYLLQWKRRQPVLPKRRKTCLTIRRHIPDDINVTLGQQVWCGNNVTENSFKDEENVCRTMTTGFVPRLSGIRSDRLKTFRSGQVRVMKFGCFLYSGDITKQIYVSLTSCNRNLHFLNPVPYLRDHHEFALVSCNYKLEPWALTPVWRLSRTYSTHFPTSDT